MSFKVLTFPEPDIIGMWKLDGYVPPIPGTRKICRMWAIDGVFCSTCGSSNVHPTYCFSEGQAIKIAKKAELPLSNIRYLGPKTIHVILRPETMTPVTRFIGQNVHGKIITWRNLGRV